MSHVTHMNESCHTGNGISVRGSLVKDVVSHIQMNHVTHTDEVTHMNESCHTYE